MKRAQGVQVDEGLIRKRRAPEQLPQLASLQLIKNEKLDKFSVNGNNKKKNIHTNEKIFKFYCLKLSQELSSTYV
jgi:hypothetical protein